MPTKANGSTNCGVSANEPPKNLQRYLYQGGVSTTLAGDVLLGKTASTSARDPSTAMAHRAGTRPSFAADGVTAKFRHHVLVPMVGARNIRRAQEGSRLRSWRRPGLGNF